MAEKMTELLHVSLHGDEGGYPTKIQGCIHKPSIQYITERKPSSL